jgi:hypothetical protein
MKNMNFVSNKEKLTSGVAVAALATGALFMTGCSADSKGGVYAYCTGSQEVTASEGASLQGMIEQYVETDPEDGLKSTTANGGSGLDILAHGISTDYSGDSVSVPLNYPETSANTTVMAGETYTLPEICEAPDNQ